MPRGRVKISVGDMVVTQSYSGLTIDGTLMVRKILGGGMCLVQKLGTGLFWYVCRDQLHKLAATQLPQPHMYFPGHDSVFIRSIDVS